MNEKLLRQYALEGARQRVELLIDEVRSLRDIFPGVMALKGAHESMTVALLAFESPSLARVPRGPDTKPRRPRAEPKPKPNPTNGTHDKAVAAMAEAAHLQSWLTGRDVLAVLASGPAEGMHIEVIRSRLKLSRGATRHRLHVRLEHGHVVRVGADEDQIWKISPEGRKALEADKDSVVKLPKRSRKSNGAPPAAAPRTIQDVADQKSWLARRPVLEALEDSEGGMNLDELAKELKVPRSVVAYRIKVSLEKHQVSLADRVKGRYAITPAGHSALETERASEAS